MGPREATQGRPPASTAEPSFVSPESPSRSLQPPQHASSHTHSPVTLAVCSALPDNAWFVPGPARLVRAEDRCRTGGLQKRASLLARLAPSLAGANRRRCTCTAPPEPSFCGSPGSWVSRVRRSCGALSAGPASSLQSRRCLEPRVRFCFSEAPLAPRPVARSKMADLSCQIYPLVSTFQIPTRLPGERRRADKY